MLFYPLFYLVTIYSIGDDFYGIFDIMFQWVDQWLLLFLFVSSFILVEIGWDRLMEQIESRVEQVRNVRE